MKIDLSVYNNNSLFRCKGQTKIMGEPRILKPWGSQASRITDDRLFLCSYVKNPKGYLAIELDPEDEKVGKYDDIDYTESSEDIIKLVKLIIDSVSSKSNKKLCDTEVPDKICYDKWKSLVFTVFNYLPEDECEKIFPSLFELYRSHKSYSMDTLLRGFIQTKGKYKYTIKSLHYWAYCSENYKTEFKTYYDIKTKKKSKTKEEKFIQDCLLGSHKSFSDFFYYLYRDNIKVFEKTSNNKHIVYYEYDPKVLLWVKHQTGDLCYKISTTLIPYIKPEIFKLQEEIKVLKNQQTGIVQTLKTKKIIDTDYKKKQKELDKQYEKEQKEYDRGLKQNIREFEKEYKSYSKRIEKLKKNTPENLLQEALRQEELTRPILRHFDADIPVRQVVENSIETVSNPSILAPNTMSIEELNLEIKKKQKDIDKVSFIVSNNLENSNFLKGIVELFISKSEIDKDFINLLENPPSHLFPFDDKVFDFKEGYHRQRTKEDYFITTTNNKILKITQDDRDLINNYVSSLITTSKMSIEDKRDHTRCLLTFLSYCLTGENHLKKILIMKGALGDNGKTCFLNLIKLVLGKFGFEPQKKVFIESKSESVHQTELFDLIDKRACYISELTETSKFNIELLKFISGNDGHKNARRANSGENKDLKLTCKLMIITNDIPKFEDKAFSNRLMCFDFPNVFEKSSTKSDEILGYHHIFFSYLCEIATDFYKGGKQFDLSKQCMITTMKEKQEKDSLLSFVEEEINFTNNPKDRMLRTEFLQEYNNYCEKFDFIKISRNKLYERFEKEYKIQLYNNKVFTGIKFQLIERCQETTGDIDPLGGLGNQGWTN
jgi:uncharacterized membrane protein